MQALAWLSPSEACRLPPHTFSLDVVCRHSAVAVFTQRAETAKHVWHVSCRTLDCADTHAPPNTGVHCHACFRFVSVHYCLRGGFIDKTTRVLEARKGDHTPYPWVLQPAAITLPVFPLGITCLNIPLACQNKFRFGGVHALHCCIHPSDFCFHSTCKGSLGRISCSMS